MACHEFAILEEAHAKGKRFDEYAPHVYNCISVDDEHIEAVVLKLNDIEFCWHSTDVKGKGLAYCGITLIPPLSLYPFYDTIKNESNLSELAKLTANAIKDNKWMIHFGL